MHRSVRWRHSSLNRDVRAPNERRGRRGRMKMTKTLPSGLLPTVLLILASTSLSAASFTFNGAFTRDDQIGLYQLSVNAPGLVTVSTNSYAAGGFSPVLSLFDSQNRNLLVGRDNGLDHTGGEATLSQELAAGTYILALTQYDNLA